MTINVNTVDEDTIVSISGRLDTVTAPELEDKLKEVYESVKNLVFDLEGLEYISSAGLRVFLGAQKTMNKVGKMSVKSVEPAVMEVFEITGFSDILNII